MKTNCHRHLYLARQFGCRDAKSAQFNGRRSITADTALRLGHWFGTSAEFWLNLQKLYELRVAQAKIGKAVERLPRRIDHEARAEHP